MAVASEVSGLTRRIVVLAFYNGALQWAQARGATTEAWPERWRPFADWHERLGGADVVVYTPDEWQALLRDPTPFVAAALADGVRVV